MQRSLLIVSISFLLSGPAAAEDWPQFRGPTGDGVSASKNVPTEWSATDHVAWKQPIPGAGWSSPVLSNGKLYLTTAVTDDEEQTSLRALCVDAANGDIVWDTELFRPEGSSARLMHSKNSLASPTPYLDGDRFYVHFGHMGTAALDLNGNAIWRQSAFSYNPLHGNGGSPIVVDELLVFSCDGLEDPFLAALDRSTGDIRWKTPRNTPAKKTFSFSTPIKIENDGQQQIISQGSGFVGGYDPADGREIWRVLYGEGYSVVPRPVFAHGLLFVSSGYERPILYAIDPKGARGDATDAHIVWQHEKGAPLTPSVLVVGDELYFVSDKGVACCVDARTDKLHWTKRLGGDYSASPILADGRIYFLSEDGVATVVKAAKEFESLATNDLGERTLASPIATDGALFIRSESHLWRIEN